MKLCIDSNVFISIHNQEKDYQICEKIINTIETNQNQGLISIIVISEILVGYYQIGELNELNQFLAKSKTIFEILPVTLDIAQEAAELRALYRIKLPDALIIASAKLNQADYLISNDIKVGKKSYIPIVTVEEFSKLGIIL